MVARKRTPERRRPAAGEKKSDATRRHLLDKALALFQKRGVAGTTMRDIARAAGMSLGAAYYYFPSKEALVFAFYEDNQREMEAVEVSGTLRERLGSLFHGKLDTIREQRAMLAAIVQRLVDPGDPLSAFSAQSRAVRDRAIAVLARALDGSVPAEVAPLAATALWLFQLASMLVYVHDTSANQARTHGLVDDGLDLLVPLIPILGTPMGRAFADRATAALARAGIALVV